MTSLGKWLSVRLRTKCSWVRIPLHLLICLRKFCSLTKGLSHFQILFHFIWFPFFWFLDTRRKKKGYLCITARMYMLFTESWKLFNYFSQNSILHCLYVLITLRTRFRVNPHPIVSWMSRNSLLETGVKSKV